jgi:hypothetical protein
MAHPLAMTIHPGIVLRKRSDYATFADDPLAAMRGIILAVLTNVLIFWVPVAIYLSR